MTDHKRPTAREIVDAVVQAMHDAHEPLDESVVLVPSIYDVMIHPSAYRQLEPILGRIHSQAVQRLERELERLNRSSGRVAGRYLQPLLRLFFPEHRLRRLEPGGQTVERAGDEWVVDVLVTADPTAKMDFLVVETDFGGRVSPVMRGDTGIDIRRRTTRLPGGGYETIVVTPREELPLRSDDREARDVWGEDRDTEAHREDAWGEDRAGVEPREDVWPDDRDIGSHREGIWSEDDVDEDDLRDLTGRTDGREAVRDEADAGDDGVADRGAEEGPPTGDGVAKELGSAHASVLAAVEALARGTARLDYEDREGRHTIYMEKPRIVIGRGREADVVLATETDVSREHVVIRREADVFEIKNVGRYGTRVNGRPLEPTGHWHPLPDRAEIILADAVSIRFQVLP